MSATGGEPEGIGAKADNIPDAVAAIIEQQMTPRSGIDLKKFKASLDGDAPPAGLGKALQALWYQARGDWERQQHEAGEELNRLTGMYVRFWLLAAPER